MATDTLLIDCVECNILVAMNTTDKLQKEFLIQLGQRIKQIRTEKGYSQSEVANRCGKERQSYQRVETGNINPTIWYLQHIATALDTELKDLLNIKLTKPKL